MPNKDEENEEFYKKLNEYGYLIGKEIVIYLKNNPEVVKKSIQDLIQHIKNYNEAPSEKICPSCKRTLNKFPNLNAITLKWFCFNCLKFV